MYQNLYKTSKTKHTMKVIKPLCIHPHFTTFIALAWYFLPFIIATSLAWLTTALPFSSYLLSFTIVYTVGMYAGYQARLMQVDMDTKLAALPPDAPDEDN